VYSPDEIRSALARGAGATAPIEYKLPIMVLVEMYLRSLRFAECVQVMLDAGASFGDRLLEALLVDDADALRVIVSESPSELSRQLRVPSAFTSLAGAPPLHVCGVQLAALRLAGIRSVHERRAQERSSQIG
jgi:hypothetical protein